MSVCKHLPHGTTLIKWRMGDFGEKYRNAVYGDMWCSDLFTTNLDGNPQCFLVFLPPVNRAAYSEAHPRLDYHGKEDHVGLAFIDGGQPDALMTTWMENEQGEVVVPKVSGTAAMARLNVQAIKRISTAAVVFLCTEIQKPACGQADDGTFEQDGQIHKIDRSAAPMEFEWECAFDRNDDHGTQESGAMAVSGTEQKLVFEADNNLGEISIKNAGVESQEPFHYQMWVENETRQQTYRTEGIARLFGQEENRLDGIWSEEADVDAFFTNDIARMRLNIRPLRTSDVFEPTKEAQLASLNRLLQFITMRFNDEKYGDIRVTAKGGTVFHVWKGVLSAQSDVFERMFEHANTKESIEQKIEMVDLEPAVVEAMLRWMHTGKVEGLKEMDSALYVMADRYHLVGLQEVCIESMSANISPDTILDYLQLAFKYDDLPTFKQQVVGYAARNLAALTHLDEWKQFMAEQPDVVNEVLRQAVNTS